MKRVRLIGDSTRIRYQPFVVEQLADVAQVTGPDANGWSSRRIREHFDDWIVAAEPDVVHLNAGLHDIAYKDEDQRPSDTRLVEPGEYREHLTWLVEQIRAGTGARVILATTTPIDEALHNATKPVIRRAADIGRYNAIVREVATAAGTGFNDLHAVMADALAAQAACADLCAPDGLHFAEAGSRLLAGAVVAAVRRVL